MNTDHVEFMLMKAFSLRVVKGAIDEVEKSVQIKWVQPRVLDRSQIAKIRDRLRAWSATVHETANHLQKTAPALLGAVAQS